MTKKEQVMDLWRKNFHDSEEFIRFYFDRKFSDENSLVYEENGQALSALLMLPYPMTWQGTTLNTSYISGACTQKEVRNHGLMTLLLQEAFLDMNKRGITISTLIPAEDWLFQYYNHLGYASVFDYSTEHYTTLPQPSASLRPILSPDHFDSEFTLQQYPFFDSKLAANTCCIQHTAEDYAAIVEDAYMSGGRLLICRHPDTGNTSGWALAVPMEDTLYVKEILYQSASDKETLLYALFDLFHPVSVSCRTLPVQPEQSRYGMARIINAETLLRHIVNHNHDLSLSIKINDPQLPLNNGIYLLGNGECQKTENTDQQTDIETDISTLAKALLGYQNDQLPQPLNGLVEKQYPYLNLMLD